MLKQIIEHHHIYVAMAFVMVGIGAPPLLPHWAGASGLTVGIIGAAVVVLAAYGDNRYAALKAEIAALRAQLAAAPLPVRNDAPSQG